MILINLILYIMVLIISFPFRILPYEYSQKLGYLITKFFFKFLKKYPKIILSNLKFAFPEKDYHFYNEIYKKNLIYIGKLLADTFLKKRMVGEWFQKRVVYNREIQEIEKEIENKLNKKEAVILISGHLGTWENLLQYLGYRFYPKTGIIYKSIKNPFVDKWFYRLRSNTGAILFPMEDSLSVIRFIRNGNLLGIAPDQNAGGAGILINFLNRPASTYKGPALIGYKSNAHIYFVAMLHLENGKMSLVYKYLGRVHPNEDKNQLIENWTKKWVSTLEQYVKQYPEQYFWVHQRWKTTPEIMQKFQQEKLKKRGIIKDFP